MESAVGVYMMELVSRIDFGDHREAIPSFLTIVLMPLAFSICRLPSASGLIYPVVKNYMRGPR